MSQRRKRAGLYWRISKDREGRAYGVERQERLTRDKAEQVGADVAGTYCDNDIPASTRSRRPRPRYDALLADVESGRLDMVVSYSTSRLTRRPMEFERLIELAEAGLRIVTCKTGDLDLNTARGRRRARDDAARDCEYAEEVGELVKLQKEQARAAGRFIGGPRAFGWRPGYAQPHPAEAPLVVGAAGAVLDGRSLAGIAAHWQEATGGTPAGKRWRPNAVRAVLRNPRHAGLTRDGVAAPHPGIVPEHRWRAVLAVLDDPARRVPERSVPVHLLTGLPSVICGGCGAGVHSGTTGAMKGTRLYRCAAAGCFARAAEPVDAFVTAVVLGYLARERVTVGPPDTGAGDAARDAAGARAQLGRLAALVLDGTLTDDEVRAEAVRLRAELAAAQARAAAEARVSALAALPTGAEALTAWWETADLEARRSVLRSLAHLVTFRVMPPGRGVRRTDPDFMAETVRVEWRQSE